MRLLPEDHRPLKLFAHLLWGVWVELDSNSYDPNDGPVRLSEMRMCGSGCDRGSHCCFTLRAVSVVLNSANETKVRSDRYTQVGGLAGLA